MEFELEFIKLLQRGSFTVGDYLFCIITQMGTELFFLIAVMVVYWCIDKREGFRLVNLFVISQLIVGSIKLAVKRTRPYYHEGIRAILERTDGYSFPSGHSNNIALIGTHASIMTKKKFKPAFVYVLSSSVLAILLVMLSRMYLGQHFLTDVLAGAAIGVVVAIVGYKLFDILGDKEEKWIFAIVPFCVLILVAVIVAYCMGKDTHSLANLAGTLSAASIGYFLEKKFVGYNVKSDRFWRYIVRILLGAAVAIGLRLGVRVLFDLLAGGLANLILNGFLIYFLVGIWVTLLAPMLFKKLKI